MSNEHLDMHGNILDEPFYCERCGREIREEDSYGTHRRGTSDLLFCSWGCVEEFEDAQLESFYDTGE